jgi:DNA-binding transcriptional LysR family regulator
MVANRNPRPGSQPGTGAKLSPSRGPESNKFRKRKPPYALRTIRPGARDVRVIISDWETARQLADAGRPVALVPEDEAVDALDFSPMRGTDVLILWRVTETTRERATALGS